MSRKALTRSFAASISESFPLSSLFFLSTITCGSSCALDSSERDRIAFSKSDYGVTVVVTVEVTVGSLYVQLVTVMVWV